MNNHTNKLRSFLGFLLLIFLLTGCADMVEIQERDFVTALGISYTEQGLLQVTYALPDLNAVTGQSAAESQDNLLRTYKAKSFPEVSEIYNINSGNRLDLRHLQAIIFDPAIGTNPEKMYELLTFLNDNYDISHNVLVFYYPGKAQELLMLDGKIGDSIGNHLKKMNKNNQKNGIKPITIGNMIECLGNDHTAVIPVLAIKDEALYFDGGILFQNNKVLKHLSPRENDLFYIMQGKGSDYLFPLSDDTVVRVNQLSSKLSYQMHSKKPYIQLTITGTGRVIPARSAAEVSSSQLSQQLNQLILGQIKEELTTFLQTDQIDVLNLYEKSSYKNRAIWMAYENQHEQFLQDLQLDVQLNIALE